MAPYFCYISIVHCRQEEFFIVKTLWILLGGKIFRKSSPIQRCLKFKRRPNGPKFVLPFYCVLQIGGIFSLLKTLGILLGGKMFRKSSPIHWCLKFKRRPNGPKFVLPFNCVLQIGGIFLCSKHQGYFQVAKCSEKIPLSTSA